MRPIPKKGYERSEVERLRVEVGKLKGKLATAEDDSKAYKLEMIRMREMLGDHRTAARRYFKLRKKELVIMEPGKGAKYLTGQALDEYLESSEITLAHFERLIMELETHFQHTVSASATLLAEKIPRPCTTDFRRL
jgi:hypothetical protein